MNKISSIIAESGSGKTTLLKLLNKLITPYKGRILYKGKSLTDLDSIQLRREVVMLAQSSIIYKGNI